MSHSQTDDMAHAAIDDEGHEHHPMLAHHFDTMAQQYASAKLGMWLFLATEILLFSGLFLAYGVFRAFHPEMFNNASRLLDLRLGTLNTGVLILSSLTMALGVRAAQTGNVKQLRLQLVLTIALAGVFMVVKYFEYSHKIHLGFLPGMFFKPHDVHGAEAAFAVTENARIFMSIYFMMTGLHGFHVLAGMFVLGWVLWLSTKRTFNSEYYTPVEIVGLYWHIVDMIWIYLFPMLYLIDRT